MSAACEALTLKTRSSRWELLLVWVLVDRRAATGAAPPGGHSEKGRGCGPRVVSLCTRAPGRDARLGPAPPPPRVPSVFQPNSSNDNIQSITSGDWDVTKILAYDETRSKM